MVNRRRLVSVENSKALIGSGTFRSCNETPNPKNFRTNKSLGMRVLNFILYCEMQKRDHWFFSGDGMVWGFIMGCHSFVMTSKK